MVRVKGCDGLVGNRRLEASLAIPSRPVKRTPTYTAAGSSDTAGRRHAASCQREGGSPAAMPFQAHKQTKPRWPDLLERISLPLVLSHKCVALADRTANSQPGWSDRRCQMESDGTSTKRRSGCTDLYTRHFRLCSSQVLNKRKKKSKKNKKLFLLHHSLLDERPLHHPPVHVTSPFLSPLFTCESGPVMRPRSGSIMHRIMENGLCHLRAHISEK